MEREEEEHVKSLGVGVGCEEVMGNICLGRGEKVTSSGCDANIRCLCETGSAGRKEDRVDMEIAKREAIGISRKRRPRRVCWAIFAKRFTGRRRSWSGR